MLRVLCVLAVCLVAVHARGAGRAFPIDAENYVIEEFQKINRFLEWDETNFLVDLSGQYANCDNIGRAAFLNVDKRTPDGTSISAYVDDTSGLNSDVDAVNKYVQTVINEWTRNFGSSIYRQIQSADRFGCSVRPGCQGRASVACLFTPGNQGDEPQPPTLEDSTQGKQYGQAFTTEQAFLYQNIGGKSWDFNHTLENIAGFEMSCQLMNENDHAAAAAERLARERGMDVVFLYGNYPNKGATQPAMEEILGKMKKIDAKKAGCAVIPDCMVGKQMFVVVGCLFDVSRY